MEYEIEQQSLIEVFDILISSLNQVTKRMSPDFTCPYLPDTFDGTLSEYDLQKVFVRYLQDSIQVHLLSSPEKNVAVHKILSAFVKNVHKKFFSTPFEDSSYVN